MKASIVAACLAASVVLAGCQTTGGAATSPAYQAAQTQVETLRASAEQQVLLAPWSGPYGGVPPWDRAEPALFPAAFEAGIALRQAEIEAIVANPVAPTFENTIVKMQDAGEHL